MRIGLVVPHIFMSDTILPKVIFAPGELSINLANHLQSKGEDVYLFTPSKVTTTANNITADMSFFENELKLRNCSYLDLLMKHPLIFISLARQVQGELIANAYTMANNNQLDIIHVYTNEEDIAITFAQLCHKPVVFTHHDPFNYYVRYRNVFPKYKNLNWVLLSYAQRVMMPKDTNWVANVYHGLDMTKYKPNYQNNSKYIVFIGRLIEPKAVHLAIKATIIYNQNHPKSKLKLIIAGKYYSEKNIPKYWLTKVKPLIDNKYIKYIGIIRNIAAKNKLLGEAKVLIIPSVFEEPFGMVMIESLACATPVIGLDSGSIPEIINDQVTGLIVKKIFNKSARSNNKNQKPSLNETKTANAIARAIDQIDTINRHDCRKIFEERFSSERMCNEYVSVYSKLINDQSNSTKVSPTAL